MVVLPALDSFDPDRLRAGKRWLSGGLIPVWAVAAAVVVALAVGIALGIAR